MSERGRFIVFEGIDGSGTSTQSKAVGAALRAGGRRTDVTFEPSTGPVGLLLREYLAGRITSADDASDRRLFAYLFAADRHDHLERTDGGMKRRLDEGIDVVCARYVLSSCAYEGDDPEELHFVESLNRRFPIPDLTVYLDCPVDVAVGRIEATRESVDVFENRDKLRRVKANYEKLLSGYAGRCLLIEATRPAEQITAEITALLRTL